MKRISLLLIFLTGCADKLDKDLTRARIDFGTSCKVFGEAAKQREVAIGTFADKAFITQKQLIEKDWLSFLGDHTDSKGCLVVKNADGTIGPMPVTELVKSLTLRSDALMNLAMAQQNFREKQAQYVGAIDMFLTDAAKITSQTVTAEDAKESTQAVLEKGLSVIGGIAAGVGGAALIGGL